VQNYGAAVLDVDCGLESWEGIQVVHAVHEGREAVCMSRVLQIGCSPCLGCFGVPE
jgi:hypothetical protein